MRTLLTLFVSLTISANAYARCTDRYGTAIQDIEKIIQSAENQSSGATVGGMTACWIIGGIATALTYGTAAGAAVIACGGITLATGTYGSHRQATAEEQKSALDLAKQGQMVLIQAQAGKGNWVDTAIAKMKTQNPELIDIPNEFTYKALNEANEKDVFCGGYYLATPDEMMAYVAKYLGTRTGQITEILEKRNQDIAKQIQEAKDNKLYALDYITSSLYHEVNSANCLREMDKNATLQRMIQQAVRTAEIKRDDEMKIEFENRIKRFCDQSVWSGDKNQKLKYGEIKQLVTVASQMK